MKKITEKTSMKTNESKQPELCDLTFNKENDGCWYIDLPNWPFAHHNLMMVAGADDLCEFLSDDGRTVKVGVAYSDQPFDVPGCCELERTQHSLTGGADYNVNKLAGFDRKIWLCPVTLFVFKCYPKYIYLKKR